MREMVCRAWGAPDVLQLENVSLRAPRPGEVRIRVRAAGSGRITVGIPRR